MKISKIHIQNFRLLKDFSIDLEDNVSIVVGKNNTGKTSILTVLDKFLGSSGNKFAYDDFNLEVRAKIIQLLIGEIPEEKKYTPLGIKAQILIEYDENDKLSDVSKLIMSLDPEDSTITLEFSYELSFQNIHKMKEEFISEKNRYNSPSNFLEENLTAYIPSVITKSISSTNPDEWIDLQKEKIKLNKVLGFQYISAKRDVTNNNQDKTLSTQTSKIYKNTSENEDHKAAIADFKTKLRFTDNELSIIYKGLFNNVIQKIKKFGGLKQDDTLIDIISTLQHRELLDGNTTVRYKQGIHDLPEHHNGLGYMNLISMIFEIEVLINKLKNNPDQNPAPLNILFIEEPEAHTHPQMQYVFIKNIKSLLNESRDLANGARLSLQTVISTHSSHIVAESDFDDIKYLKRLNPFSVESKNLNSLSEKYSGNSIKKQHYKFLKQYLTLNRAEVFFADKIIMIEGDTERILLPAMMKKIDQEQDATDELPLLSQNVSIIEVGAHSKTFEEFIVFLGVKTLIITDIDSGYIKTDDASGATPKKDQVKCLPDDEKAQYTTNSSLTHFHNKKRDDLKYFRDLKKAKKCLKRVGDSWVQDKDGLVFIAYQTKENNYHARSFEDAFFNLNHTLLSEKGHDAFPSLTKKWFDKYEEDKQHFEFSKNGVRSKPSLAIEILINSENDENGNNYMNWKIPGYIKEGLKWLKQG